MSRVINFGLWYDFRNPPPRRQSFEALYAASLDQIAWAESIGFDSVWLTEHHFCEDGYTPSPFVLAAAIATRTQRMRVGTNLVLLPLADPMRLAEDAAALSILSGGRFDLGVGLGYRQLEFEYFGRSLKNRPSLMEEGVEILRRAWRGEAINFSGKRFRVGDIALGPVPTAPPALLMGGLSEPAIRRAARLGDGFLSVGGVGHDIYLAAAKEFDRQAAIFAGSWAIIAPDPEKELSDVGPHVLYQVNEYAKWGAFGPPEEAVLFPDPETAIRESLYELWDAEIAIKELTGMLREYPEVRDVHFWAQFPGESVEHGSRRIEYIAQQVLPRVRAALD